jgi:hypothetical protein
MTTELESDREMKTQRSELLSYHYRKSGKASHSIIN